MADLDQRVTRYLDWIRQEIDYSLAYHDQKERAAWTATAFYVPAIIVLGHQAGTALAPYRGLKPFLVLLIIAALAATFMFVAMQFNRRWAIADLAAALRHLRAELIADPSIVQDAEAVSLPPSNADIPVWPAFMRRRILQYRTERSPQTVCTAAWRGVLFMWGDIYWPPCHFMPCVEMRTRSEAASYAIMVLATLVAVGAVFAA